MSEPPRAQASLVERARRGDAEALGELVRTSIPQVERMLHRLLGHRRDHEDLVQSVFLELARSIGSFRGESAFSTFVGGITIRIARRARRPTAWQRRSTPLLEEPVVEGTEPEHKVNADELLRRAMSLLDDLPEVQRTAFVLWALEGHDPATIATMMEATLPATRSRIFYAQKRLAQGAEQDPWLSEWLLGGRDEP